MKWTRLLLVVVLLPALLRAAPLKVEFKQSASSVEMFDFVEIIANVAKPDAANPFTEVVLSGEITPPEGQPIKVDGFCDAADGSVFRLRFMPRTQGKHHFTLMFRQGDFAARHQGVFTAKKGKLPGPVRVDPQHPFHFVREGTGEHWFWNATTTYQLLAWDDETIAASVERLAKLGVNRLRIVLCARTKDGKRWNEPLVLPTDRFKFRIEPWVASQPENPDDPGYDVRRFNVAMFQKAERLLRLARVRGVVISLIFYVDGADKGVEPFGKARMGGPDEQRYYRYAAARFSAFANIMWDVTNEWHLFRDEAWVNRMGAFLKECDPYDHIMSVHGHGKFPFRTSAWVDFAMFQSWDEHGSYEFMLKNRREQTATGRPMPQVNEEYGYEDHYPFPWGEKRLWPARIGDNRRRLAWEMCMAGCYQTTGERANDGTGAGPDTGGGWINGRGNETMTMLIGYRHMMSFFTSFAWWKLEPRDDLAGANTRLLAEAGKCYAAYLPTGGAASFKLAPGNYRVRLYNPRTGEWQSLANVQQTAEAVWTSPAPPDAGDWVFLLERSGR